MAKLSIIILVLAVVGVGGWVVYQSNQPADQDRATTATTNTRTGGTSLASLFERGENLVCDYQYADAFGSQTGTVYTSGINVRGDFTMTATDGTVTTSHIIRDDQYHYNWGAVNGEPIGTRIRLADFASATDLTVDTNTSGQTSLDYDYQYDFDCQPWTVDQSLFAVPSDIAFSDLTLPTEVGSPLTAEAKAAACQACEQNAETRDQCRLALGC